MSEPAVVHNEKLDAKLLCLLGVIDEGFLIEVKPRALPAVDKQRSLFIFPLASYKIVIVKVVISAAHLAESLVGIDHNDLRTLELVARLNNPCEINRIDAHYKPCAVVIIGFDICGEIAAVNEVEAVGIAEVLAALIVNEGNERVVVVA